MRNLFIFTFLSFLFASITTTAFEDDRENNNVNIIYKLNANLDDLVLNYCNTYDSYTVNRLYSQKKTLDEKINLKTTNKFLVSLKKKPLNPNLTKLIDTRSNLKVLNQNINEIYIDFLSESKKDFVKTLLPLISYENQNILLERSKLDNIKIYLDNNKTLPKSDLKFLYKISKKYKLKTKDKHKFDLVKELLDLVDIIPNSIVLAQAANESGWGTSRFALEGNALFGQWTWSGEGIKPADADNNATHKVMKFKILKSSIRAYQRNLNTHSGYKEFRMARAELRDNGRNLNSLILANYLNRYAETGQEYIKIIKQIIKQNNLTDFDDVKLLPSSIQLKSLI